MKSLSEDISDWEPFYLCRTRSLHWGIPSGSSALIRMICRFRPLVRCCFFYWRQRISGIVVLRQLSWTLVYSPMFGRLARISFLVLAWCLLVNWKNTSEQRMPLIESNTMVSMCVNALAYTGKQCFVPLNFLCAYGILFIYFIVKYFLFFLNILFIYHVNLYLLMIYLLTS